MKFVLPEIRHNKVGFEALVCLVKDSEDCSFDDVEIDMGQKSWFDADMCAAFGAVLYRLGKNINEISITNIHPNVERILSKNIFLSHYGRATVLDNCGTTISYKRFDAKDDRYFADYIENELMRRSEIPIMSLGLRKKFHESIFEIFSNAVIHSRTELGIFSCGQFYPKNQQIYFSVADLGIGIRNNIKENLGTDLTPKEAIMWATQGRNTTKRGNIPGGLGLKLLIEFIDLNDGRIQIVSDAGYWKREGKQSQFEDLSYPFPGTVVSLEINTTDTNSYRLYSERNEMDIF